MAQRNKRDPDDEITVGFKTAQRYAAWVHRAAAKQGVSASKFLEKVVLKAAADELGLPKDEVAAALQPVKPASATIADAARAEGITPREFARRAALAAAESVLAQPKRKPSGARRIPR